MNNNRDGLNDKYTEFDTEDEMTRFCVDNNITEDNTIQLTDKTEVFLDNEDFKDSIRYGEAFYDKEPLDFRTEKYKGMEPSFQAKLRNSLIQKYNEEHPSEEEQEDVEQSNRIYISYDTQRFEQISKCPWTNTWIMGHNNERPYDKVSWNPEQDIDEKVTIVSYNKDELRKIREEGPNNKWYVWHTSSGKYRISHYTKNFYIGHR